MRAAVINLGCPKNEVDAEKLLQLLLEEGFNLVAEPADAEVIIVNTCAFIQPAVEEAINSILNLAENKKTANCRILAVGGCLPQRYGADLLKEMPEIDILAGADSFPEIPAAIRDFKPGEPPRNLVRQTCDLNYSNALRLPQLVSAPRAFSYLKIAEGCDHRCSYCMIPAIKGRQQSFPLPILLAHARKMVSDGVKELNVIAQDITAYGRDLSEKPSLCDLLNKLLQIPDLERLRLLYAYPHRVSAELIRLLATENKLCRYLDIPIQHISDSVLKAMGRPEKGVTIQRTLEKLKTEVPDIFLRSTVMVGFPGETEADFKELLNFIEKGFFAYLGAFPYSAESGSRAAALPQQVADEVKTERLQAVLAAQQEITERWLRAKIGCRERVVIEGLSQESDLLLQGRCDFQAPEIDGVTYITEIDGDISPGLMVEAEIYDSHEFDLFARVVETGTKIAC